MPVTDAPTLAQVLTLAQRLPPADKLRLIARLAPDLAEDLPADTADDSWDELLRFGDEAKSLPPLAEDSAEVLSALIR
jgi:hypothetical protein